MRQADAAVATLSRLLASRDAAALARFAEHDLYPAIDPFTATIGRLVDLQIDVARRELAVAHDAAARSRTIMIAAGLAGLAMTATCLGIVTVSVARPMSDSNATGCGARIVAKRFPTHSRIIARTPEPLIPPPVTLRPTLNARSGGRVTARSYTIL